MRIEKLAFTEMTTGWRLEPMEFFADLTLLVGVSGVGKTKVLRAIESLRAIATGESRNGVCWEVSFLIDEARYLWTGEFEAKDDSLTAEDTEESGEDEGPRILSETLRRGDAVLIERDVEGIRLRGELTPKLAPHESAIHLFRTEPDLRPVHQGWAQVLSPNDEWPGPFLAGNAIVLGTEFKKHCQRYTTLESIQNAKFPTAYKLTLLHRADPATFARIFRRFQEIFDQVEELRFSVRRDAHFAVRETPVLELREVGSSTWIPANQISSGMLRTLYHLARMALWPAGTVVLIDEFENSLGVNCIDFITQDLQHQGGRLQFIVTSHHPYIINNVSQRYWKILSRKGPVVSAASAEELKLGRSNHQAFIQLLNNERFREGVTTP